MILDLGLLIFEPMQTIGSIYVEIIKDIIPEEDVHFSVILSGPQIEPINRNEKPPGSSATSSTTK